MTPLTLQQPDDFEALLEAHREPLRRFLVSLTASGAVADDLTQETCLVLWRKRDKFEPGTNFKAWAFKIAFFTVKNHRRKVARAKELALPDEGLLDKLAAKAETLDDRWDDEAEHLPHCLSKLPERNRELVTRRYMGKVSVQELATERGMTPNAMSQQLFGSNARCVSAWRSNSIQKRQATSHESGTRIRRYSRCVRRARTL